MYAGGIRVRTIAKVLGGIKLQRNFAHEFSVTELGSDELAWLHVLDAHDHFFVFRIQGYRVSASKRFQRTDRIENLRYSFQLLGPCLHKPIYRVVQRLMQVI